MCDSPATVLALTDLGKPLVSFKRVSAGSHEIERRIEIGAAERCIGCGSADFPVQLVCHEGLSDRAAQNMLLAAWNEGVSSCPNGISDADAAHAALALGDDETLVIVLTFGVPERRRDPESRTPAEWSERANRRPLDDVVRRVR